jgi:hypothetical protein
MIQIISFWALQWQFEYIIGNPPHSFLLPVSDGGSGSLGREGIVRFSYEKMPAILWMQRPSPI